MIEEFNDKIQNVNALIIGVDFVGMMIAAKLGTISQKPFSYMISDKNSEYYGQHDKQAKIGTNKVIIVTDAIVTGETVNNIIKQLQSNYGIKKKK